MWPTPTPVLMLEHIFLPSYYSPICLSNLYDPNSIPLHCLVTWTMRWLFNSCIFHWDKKGSRVFCRTEDHAGEQVQGPQVPSSSPWGDSIYQLICNSNSVWTWHHYFGLSGILWATYGEEPRGASISMWNQKDTWNLFFVVSAEILRYGFQLLRSTKHAYKYCSKVMKNVQL